MRGGVFALLLLAGCNVVDAPEDLEELMVYGFENFSRDDDFLIAMSDNLLPQVDAQYEAIAEGYRIDSLTIEQIEANGLEDVDVNEIFGAMGALSYRHTVAEVVTPMVAPNRAELFPEAILAYEVTAETEGDPECFASAACARYDFTFEETADVGMLGQSTRTVTTSYRWIDPPESQPYVAILSLTPGGVDLTSGIIVVHQQYGLALVYPFEATARRVEAFWIDGEVIGMDVPDYFAVEQAVGAMATQGERIDDWLDVESGVSTEPPEG